MAAVEVTRTEVSAAALRRQAARSRDAEAARRMSAVALVLVDGHSRADAAEARGMDRQTLRDRVHRHNAEGIGGPMDRRAPGPAPRLSAEREGEPARRVEGGPEPERDGAVRRRRRDLQERVGRTSGIRFHERAIGELPAKLRFRRLSVRPRRPRSDPAARQASRGASPGR